MVWYQRPAEWREGIGCGRPPATALRLRSVITSSRMGGEIVGETAGRKRGRGRDRAVARQGDGERPGQAERSTP
ncbi:MAG: hypothetical protein ACR2OO_11335, partial [Thermomicrobiales bacterium]